MKTFRAKIRAGGVGNDATVQARNPAAARKLLEAQYGHGNVFAVMEVQ